MPALDVAGAAVEAVWKRKRSPATRVHRIRADPTRTNRPAPAEVWCDREDFHFLTGERDRSREEARGEPEDGVQSAPARERAPAGPAHPTDRRGTSEGLLTGFAEGSSRKGPEPSP